MTKMRERTCRDCGEEFTPTPRKWGFIDQCLKCSIDIPMVGGNMVWDHKTAPELEIKSMHEARDFARRTRRFGAGVTSSLVTSKLDSASIESSKRGSGTESRSQYYSRLGERRSVK